MSADASVNTPLRLRGHFDSPVINTFQNFAVNSRSSNKESPQKNNYYEEEENTLTTSLLVQPWIPHLKHFTTVIKFTIAEDDPPLKPYRIKINTSMLKHAWKGTKQEEMCKMRFENALVKRILIANKSTQSNFNAALKFFDKDDQLLYHPVPTFDCEDEENESDLSGIPLWGDQVGAREVFHNPEPPTQTQMAYANFNVEDLERTDLFARGVTHHTYDVPNRESKGRRGAKEVSQKMEITHVPKEPCARYFEWALTEQNDLYPRGFTDSPAHAVGGLPDYFCIHSHDYRKVAEAFKEKKKSVGTQNIETIKVVLEPTDKRRRQLPAGVHCFQIDFEVWMAAIDLRDEEYEDDN